LKILSLQVAGVGRFDQPIAVAGFGEGVNVLCESNEAGKSTLFRALRACLFERHSTVNATVSALACDGLALPVSVRLGFEHAGESYEIEKSFLKQKSASLRRGGREIARMSEADEMLWELLGVRPGSGRAIDQARFGLLWVSQGQSFEQPALSEAASGALGAAIHAEVGALVGGERARLLLAELKRDIGVFVTDSAAKPRAGGPLATALNTLAALTAEISEAERKLSAMESQIARLAQARRERAVEADPEGAEALAQDQRAAEAELAAALAARERLTLREPMLMVMVARRDEAERALRETDERIQRIDADRTTAAALGETLERLAQEASEAEGRLAQARAESEAGAVAEVADESALAQLKALAAALSESDLAPDLKARRAAIAEACHRLDRLDVDLSASRVRDGAAETLDAIEREIAALLARIDAGAVRLQIVVAPEGVGQISVDGSPTAGVTLHAAEPVVISAGGLATITVTPPAGGEAHQEKRRGLEARRALLLAELGFADGEALRLADQHRRALERDRLGALGAFKGLGVEPAKARAQMEELERRIDGPLRRGAAALAASGREAMPEAAALAAEIAAIEARRAGAREARARIEGRKDSANAALLRVFSERGRGQAELEDAERRLSLDLAALPDLRRAEASAAAREALRVAAEALSTEAAAIDDLRRATPDADRLKQLQTRVERLRRAGEGRLARIAELDRTIAHLEGQIESVGAEGLGERLAALKDDAALWRRQADKHEKRVRTLQSLHDAVVACLDEQRERLHAPIKRHLKPYLEDVFASADPELGEGYAIHGLSRGAARERLELLSDGTKEQIAVLTRLAMGSLLAERGEAVPIILDDALVYSDDERIERMFDALNRAAAAQQVIVFTCRTRAFRALGGQRLTLSPGSPA